MLLHALAALAVGVSGIPVPAGAVAMIVIMGSLLQESRRWSRPSGFLCYGEQQGWALERGDGSREPLAIRGSTVVTPWVVFVHAHGGRADYAWMLLAAPGDPDTFRQLRVRLRIAGVQNVLSAQREPSPNKDG